VSRKERALSLLVVTNSKLSINVITNPNTVYKQSRDIILIVLPERHPSYNILLPLLQQKAPDISTELN
jgi:hypothetical protein